MASEKGPLSPIVTAANRGATDLFLLDLLMFLLSDFGTLVSREALTEFPRNAAVQPG